MPTSKNQSTIKYTNALTNSASYSIRDHCGTSQAAEMLGLSVGTIQKLVDQQILQSWKTQGGHRKIAMASIFEYQRKFNIIPPKSKPIERRLRVLLVEDDAITRQLILEYCNNTTVSVECTAMATGMEALMHIADIQPDLLITDLDMPGVDGFELLRLLRKNSQFDQMLILILTTLTKAEIENRGELPEGSIYLSKPAKASWFNGFFEGIILGSHKEKNDDPRINWSK